MLQAVLVTHRLLLTVYTETEWVMVDRATCGEGVDFYNALVKITILSFLLT